MESDSVTIEVSPETAMADEPQSIRVSGLPPGRRVTVRASTQDDSNARWESWAEFRSDGGGGLDLDGAAPVDGTYEGRDGTGLLWSMLPDPKKDAPPFTKQNADPLLVDLSIDIDGTVLSSRRITRGFLAPGVETTTLDEGGLVGTYFRPPGGGPFPAVLLLHGTVPRMLVEYGALLASRGYAALALQYFKAEGLPGEFIEIPLEYFGKALDWLGSRPEVDSGRIAVQGVSRGGELALLVGATFSEVRAVVSIAGSGVVFQGLPADPRDGSSRSAWSRGGEPVPFVMRRDSMTFTLRAIWAGISGGSFSTLSTYIAGLDYGDAAEEASIPVEKIGGPVLLASGGRDRMWPSERCSRMAAERIERSGRGPVELLVYPDAGHGIGLPYRPTTLGYIPSYGKSKLSLGGSPAADAAASADLWPKVLGLYERVLRS